MHWVALYPRYQQRKGRFIYSLDYALNEYVKINLQLIRRSTVLSVFLAACCKKRKRNKHDHDVRHPSAYLTAGLTACRPVSLSVCYFRCCFLGALQDFGLYVKVLCVCACVWESCNCVCNCLLSNASATATATTLWQQLQCATLDRAEDVFIWSRLN